MNLWNSASEVVLFRLARRSGVEPCLWASPNLESDYPIPELGVFLQSGVCFSGSVVCTRWGLEWRKMWERSAHFLTETGKHNCANDPEWVLSSPPWTWELESHMRFDFNLTSNIQKMSGQAFCCDIPIVSNALHGRGKFWGRTGGLGRPIFNVSKKEKLLLAAGVGGGWGIRPELQGRGMVARCLWWEEIHPWPHGGSWQVSRAVGLGRTLKLKCGFSAELLLKTV